MSTLVEGAGSGAEADTGNDAPGVISQIKEVTPLSSIHSDFNQDVDGTSVEQAKTTHSVIRSKNTKIPVPEVYYTVSTRTILSWTKFTAEGRHKIITQLAEFQAQLLELEFTEVSRAFTRLYFPPTIVDRSRLLEISSSPISAELDLLTNRPAEWIKERQNENAFVLFHDDFNEGNIIVSLSDPRSSGLLTGKACASRPFGTPDACVPFYGKIS
ncbi:hypothetical protein B0H13DRAFT_1875191 [Mycena leptocephala]|nr:hypothetical protein B0H13DRAFT_1875191 [Mycena leptocephala]